MKAKKIKKNVTGAEIYNDEKNYKGIADAEVQFYDVEKKILLKETAKTDKKGRFEIDLPPGKYIVISKDGKHYPNEEFPLGRGGNPDKTQPPPSYVIELKQDSVEPNVIVAGRKTKTKTKTKTDRKRKSPIIEGKVILRCGKDDEKTTGLELMKEPGYQTKVTLYQLDNSGNPQPVSGKEDIETKKDGTYSIDVDLGTNYVVGTKYPNLDYIFYHYPSKIYNWGRGGQQNKTQEYPSKPISITEKNKVERNVIVALPPFVLIRPKINPNPHHVRPNDNNFGIGSQLNVNPNDVFEEDFEIIINDPKIENMPMFFVAKILLDGKPVNPSEWDIKYSTDKTTKTGKHIFKKHFFLRPIFGDDKFWRELDKDAREINFKLKVPNRVDFVNKKFVLRIELYEAKYNWPTTMAGFKKGALEWWKNYPVIETLDCNQVEFEVIDNREFEINGKSI